MKSRYHACLPFIETIEKKFQDGEWIISWDCDTIGHHEAKFKTEEEADACYADLLSNPSSFSQGMQSRL